MTRPFLFAHECLSSWASTLSHRLEGMGTVFLDVYISGGRFIPGRHRKRICICKFSDHNALKLELNHNKMFGRTSNTWRLRTILLKMKGSARKKLLPIHYQLNIIQHSTKAQCHFLIHQVTKDYWA